MEKKEFRNYLCLTLNKGILLRFLVTLVYKTFGIKREVREIFIFLKFDKRA